MKYCITINSKRYVVEVGKGEATIISAKDITVGRMEDKRKTNIEAIATTIDPKHSELEKANSRG